MLLNLLVLISLSAQGATVPDEYPTIAAAAQSVAPGSVITVAPGAYSEAVVIDRDLIIEGEDHAVKVILEAGGAGPIFTVDGGATLVLRNLTLDGREQAQGVHLAPDSSLDFHDSVCRDGLAPTGACIQGEGVTDVHIKGSIFYGGYANSGGHISVSGGELLIDSSRFWDGYAKYDGGSIMAGQGVVTTIRDSRFESNVAEVGDGGAVMSWGPLTVQDTWFHRSRADFGGAIFAGADLDFQGGAFIENKANFRGGAVFSTYGDTGLVSAILVQNSAEEGGALFFDGNVDAVVRGSWLVGNEALNGGGAILSIAVSQLSLRDSMLRQNRADRGSVMYFDGYGMMGMSRNFICNNKSYSGAGLETWGTRAELELNVLALNDSATTAARLNSADVYVGNNMFLANVGTLDGAATLFQTDRYSSEYNLYGWTQGGTALQGKALGEFSSIGDWFYSNQLGDHGRLAVTSATYANPDLNLFHPNLGCDQMDLRSRTLVNSGVGPWEAGSPRWYQDLDGDGHVGLEDCDDTNPVMNPGTRWYLDADGDGYGDSSVMQRQCEPPGADWVLTSGDCDPSDPRYNVPVTAWLDQDGDGYGAPGTQLQFCGSLPQNRVLNSLDCDDGDAAIHPGTIWYLDSDNDGYGDPAMATGPMCEPPAGANYVLNSADCNDNDPLIHPNTMWFADADEDGYGDPSAPYGPICSPPDGYVLDASDCDDTDPAIHPMTIWYPDTDGDGYGDPASPAGPVCAQPSGHVLDGSDCDDTNALINPTTIWYRDVDGDGFGDPNHPTGPVCQQPTDHVLDATDCDDSDEMVNPSASEVCDGIDNDCNGWIDDEDPGVDSAGFTAWYPDSDGDGFGDEAAAPTLQCDAPAGFVDDNSDCDDANSAIHPQTVWYQDADGDGFGDSAVSRGPICEQPLGFVLDASDCDDGDSEVHPDADEICDGIDNNCDTVIDDDAIDRTLWYEDADGDGWGVTESTALTCDAPIGYVADDGDCDDTDPLIHPETVWYPDADEDGFGEDAGAVIRCEALDGWVLTGGDCDDADPAVNPMAIEVCDGIDNDCDGLTDLHAIDAEIWAPDLDGDGFGDDNGAVAICDPPADWVQILGDCDDLDATTYPGAPEICDNKDNDCDGVADNDPIDPLPWYPDADGDGWGDGDGEPTFACEPPAGFGPEGDCDDADADVHPEAIEVCDGIDNSCNGLVDDEDPELELDSAPLWYPDADGDGAGDAGAEPMPACEGPDGYVLDGSDCDDEDPERIEDCTVDPPSDFDPPSNGKAEVSPPDGPSRYGIACQHGAPGALPIWMLGMAAMLVRRRRQA